MAHQTAVDIIRVISEAVNPTGQFAYLRTWDASLEFNEVDQKIFLYPISGQVDITNGYFETWTCSMGFFFQDAPDSTNEQREQLITNADVLLKAFILAADTVDGVQFSIVRKRPVYRDMAGTYSGYLVDFTLSLTEDICNGDTPSVIIPVGKTFCELVDECLGISVSGDEDLVLNQKGEWVQGGGGAVDSVNGKTGVVVLDADDIAETATRFWLTNILKSAYDSAVTWISTNGTNLLNHLTNTSNPHSTTAAQVGAPSGSGTSTGTNTGDQDLTGLQDKRIVVSTNTTAAIDGAYTLVASATFTDPTPIEGKGYSVLIRNGTATIGGTPYSTVGTLVWRLFHSGSWATYVLTNQTQLNDKQDTLVSATNIKTINGSSVLGSGDLSIGAGALSVIGVPTTNITATGLTVETALLVIPLPVDSNNYLFRLSYLLRVTSTPLLYIRIGTTAAPINGNVGSNSIGQQTQIATFTPVSTNINTFIRNFQIQGGSSGTLIGRFFSQNVSTDEVIPAGISTLTVNTTVQQYLYISCGLWIVGQVVTLYGGFTQQIKMN